MQYPCDLLHCLGTYRNLCVNVHMCCHVCIGCMQHLQLPLIIWKRGAMCICTSGGLQCQTLLIVPARYCLMKASIQAVLPCMYVYISEMWQDGVHHHRNQSRRGNNICRSGRQRPCFARKHNFSKRQKEQLLTSCQTAACPVLSIHTACSRLRLHRLLQLWGGACIKQLEQLLETDSLLATFEAYSI